MGLEEAKTHGHRVKSSCHIEAACGLVVKWARKGCPLGAWHKTSPVGGQIRRDILGGPTTPEV